MVITEKELQEILTPRHFLERVSSVSSDGKNLLVRIPKEVVHYLSLSKSDKIKFVVTKDKKISLEVFYDSKKEKADH